MAQFDLDSRTLYVSVWDWDRFGRNQFLGEVRLPLSSLDLTDSTDKWYTLQDKVYKALYIACINTFTHSKIFIVPFFDQSLCSLFNHPSFNM